jgi:hypothetical protein
MILLNSLVTPFYIAFPEVSTYEIEIIEKILNAVFIADLILSFNTAYYNPREHKVVDSYIVKIQPKADSLVGHRGELSHGLVLGRLNQCPPLRAPDPAESWVAEPSGLLC